jgi:hypothetical protein
VLFVIGQADKSERAQILDVIFELSREEILRRVERDTMNRRMLYVYDYVHDTLPAEERAHMPFEQASPRSL